jgi:hypothetical protein
LKTETITFGSITLEIAPVVMPPLKRIAMHSGPYGELTCLIGKQMVAVGEEFEFAGGTFIVKESEPQNGFCRVVASGKTKADYDLAISNGVGWHWI